MRVFVAGGTGVSGGAVPHLVARGHQVTLRREPGKLSSAARARCFVMDYWMRCRSVRRPAARRHDRAADAAISMRMPASRLCIRIGGSPPYRCHRGTTTFCCCRCDRRIPVVAQATPAGNGVREGDG